MTDPADLDLRAAVTAVAGGALTAAELRDACQARAAEFAELGAFVAMAPTHDPAGPGRLHGAPVGVKDLVDVAGLPTRAGSAATDDRPARADAPIVATLRAAGATVLGKTATHEFAYGVTTRAVRNPWDAERLAGGSSGGSAVAVAVGACPLALGSDTAGSCRIPAAFCGVAGMMARPGRLPADGVVALAPGLDALGLLAHSAADLAFAWTALMGEPVPTPDAPRIATVPDSGLGDVEPAALAATEEAAAALDGRRVALDLPPFEEFARARATVIAAAALDEHRRRGWWPDRAGLYGEDVAGELRAAEEIGEDDVLVLPSTPGPAPSRELDDSLARVERRHAARLTFLCGPVNAAGLAAVSAFAGLDPGGLPLGVQFVAADEATALGTAVAYEALTGPPPRPPLLTGAAAGNHASGEAP